jgi:hypothetical protein
MNRGLNSRPFEARAFAYSFNNLNRGTSETHPSGYADGFGIEGRYYIGPEYASLGTAGYDIARASFISAGFYPTKDMVNAEGEDFKPGPFVRAYLTYDLLGPRCYLYGDVQLIGTRGFTLELIKADAGVSVRPFANAPMLEFRLGWNAWYGPRTGDLENGVYGQVRFMF